MKNKLYIIGNGFDLAHKLPTRFDPDFKRIAVQYESNDFWDLYQTRKNDIWSDFENLLACPDFNSLEEIFDGYAPDYMSDRESDRDGIIYQTEINGNLQRALYEFSKQAENALCGVCENSLISQILDFKGLYINFNYTHTLEEIYGIPYTQVLHIHGEVGANNLKLGYPEGNFVPEKYSFDIRGKGRGPYSQVDIEDHINGIEDYYVRTAYTSLYEKCKMFYKEINIGLLKEFLDSGQYQIEEIIIYGHSCAIDYDYFDYLNVRYSNAKWIFYVMGTEQEHNVYNLIRKYGIININIVRL